MDAEPTELVDGPSPGLDGTAATDSNSSIPADATAVTDGGEGEPDAADIVVCDSGQQAIEVCVQYYDYLSTCTGRDFRADACDPSLIPDGAADLAYIEMLCAINLQRIQQACR
jgi:hypothetical protein